MKKFTPEKGSDEELSDINITPLTDLSLTLLIMLMLISPMIVQSMINVMASQAVQSKVQNELKEKPLYVDLRLSGIYLNDNKMKGEEDFFLKLRGELSRKKDKTVLVTVQQKVLHGEMVKILDISKQAGAQKLSLLKRKSG
ncbi:MAG: biopolymer transporter ExbD [bacterium]